MTHLAKVVVVGLEHIQVPGAEGGVVQPRTRSTGEIMKPTTRQHSMT